MKLFKMLLASSFLFSAGLFTGGMSTTAVAHEGQLDSMGCHYNRSYRDYHCHEGKLEGRKFKSRAEAIRNYNRIHTKKKDDEDDDGGIF